MSQMSPRMICLIIVCLTCCIGIAGEPNDKTNLDSFLIHIGLLGFADYALILICLGLLSFLAIGILPIIKRFFSICYNLFYK